ncbi:MAG: flagellar hook-associated protein FlgK [Bdellovibrio sp.]|nr:flagellar hook-associated protein FlgK [Bdellovibrio sp.]
MAKIHGLMDMGKRSLMLNQTALQTTSHNIANKSTEGYSRQRVDIQTSPALGDGKTRTGSGAEAAGITRSNNPWLEKQIEREGSSLAFADGRSQALAKIETVMNEQTVKGMNGSVTNFFNSFRELASNPESATVRTIVRDNSTSLIRNFQDMDRQIDGVVGELNKEIETGVRDVNGLTKEISGLNQKIMNVEITGAHANDERDRRDLLVKNLAEKLNISYAEDTKTGMLNITGGQTGILVAGTSANELKTELNSDNKMIVQAELSKNGMRSDITDQFTRGSVGAAIELREGIVTDLKTQLESLAYNIATEVNRAHTEGFDRNGKPAGELFDIPKTGEFSIQDLKLNKAIMNDVSLIAAGAKANAPGDNTTANVIHSLQFKPLMEDGKYTFDDFYNSKVGQIGVMAQTANSSFESQKNVVDQLKNTRESISGVNLDEEASKMIEFQKSFEASARMIKLADEMFDTVLNLKRM